MALADGGQPLAGGVHDGIVHGAAGGACDEDGHEPVQAAKGGLALRNEGHGHGVRGEDLRCAEDGDVGKVGDEVDGDDDEMGEDAADDDVAGHWTTDLLHHVHAIVHAAVGELGGVEGQHVVAQVGAGEGEQVLDVLVVAGGNIPDAGHHDDDQTGQLSKREKVGCPDRSFGAVALNCS